MKLKGKYLKYPSGGGAVGAVSSNELDALDLLSHVSGSCAYMHSWKVLMRVESIALARFYSPELQSRNALYSPLGGWEEAALAPPLRSRSSCRRGSKRAPKQSYMPYGGWVTCPSAREAPLHHRRGLLLQLMLL